MELAASGPAPKSGTDYYEKDDTGKTIEVDGRAKIKRTWDLIQMTLSGSEHHAIRCNLDFFLRLRHQDRAQIHSGP